MGCSCSKFGVFTRIWYQIWPSLDKIWCVIALNLAIGYYFQRKFDRFVSTRLGGIFGTSVLAKATRSREMCVIRELSGSHYPSHEPGQAPNDPYGALRATEGQSRLKWRQRRIAADGRSRRSVHSCGTAIHTRTAASTSFECSNASRAQHQPQH